MPINDNLDQLAPTFAAFAQSVDFTSAGKEGSLGAGLIGLVIEGIADRNAQEVGPDGASWPENQGTYGEKKQSAGIPVGVGFRDGSPGGQMVSQDQLKGEVEITPDEATVSYGHNEFAIRKAQWFTNGSNGTDGEPSGAVNQPPRPFYAMSDEDAERITEAAEAFLNDQLGGL